MVAISPLILALAVSGQALAKHSTTPKVESTHAVPTEAHTETHSHESHSIPTWTTGAHRPTPEVTERAASENPSHVFTFTKSLIKKPLPTGKPSPFSKISHSHESHSHENTHTVSERAIPTGLEPHSHAFTFTEPFSERPFPTESFSKKLIPTESPFHFSHTVSGRAVPTSELHHSHASEEPHSHSFTFIETFTKRPIPTEKPTPISKVSHSQQPHSHENAHTVNEPAIPTEVTHSHSFTFTKTFSEKPFPTPKSELPHSHTRPEITVTFSHPSTLITKVSPHPTHTFTSRA